MGLILPNSHHSNSYITFVVCLVGCVLRIINDLYIVNELYIIQAGGLCVKDQLFGVASKVPDEYLQYQFDGAVGMGFMADSNAATDVPWFYNLMQNKSLNISKNPYFTFYLNGCVCVCVRVCVCMYVCICVWAFVHV